MDQPRGGRATEDRDEMDVPACGRGISYEIIASRVGGSQGGIGQREFPSMTSSSIIHFNQLLNHITSQTFIRQSSSQCLFMM